MSPKSSFVVSVIIVGFLHSFVSAEGSFSISAVTYPTEDKILGKGAGNPSNDQVTLSPQNDGNENTLHDPTLPECIRINMTGPSTPRRNNVMLCMMLSPEDIDQKVDFVLDCMAKNDIYTTDEDMVGFISVHPYHECIASMHDLDDKHRVLTNLRNKDTENMTLSSTLCIEVYISEKHREKQEFYRTDACFTNDPRLEGMSLDEEGMPIMSTDKDIVEEIYLETCYQPDVGKSIDHIMEDDVMDFRIVPMADQCKRRIFRDFGIKQSGYKTIYKVGLGVSGAGMVGCLILIGALLGKEYRQSHKISPLLALQITFNLFLLGICLKQNVEYVLEYSLAVRPFVSPSCIAGLYFFVMTSSGSVQVMLAIAIERWYAIAHPFFHRTKCTIKFNVKIAAFIVALSNILSIFTVVSTYFFELTSFCRLQQQSDALIAGAAYSIAWSILVCLIPWILIFIFTGVTGWKLIQHSAARREMTSQDTRGKNEHKVTIMVLLSFINFVVWSVPEVGVRVISLLFHLKLTYFHQIEIFNIIIFVGIEWKCLILLVIYFVMDKEIREQIVINTDKMKRFCIRQQ